MFSGYGHKVYLKETVDTKVVHKFAIPIKAEFCINMPLEAQILSVAAQRGSPYLWALVNPSVVKSTRKFAMHGTGDTITKSPGDKYEFIGTVLLEDGDAVFHLFEKNKP